MVVSNKEIMRYLKMGNTVPSERISALIEEIVCVFREKITPKSLYAVYECEVNPPNVTFCGLTISSRSLSGHLGYCRRIALLAVTLGASVDMLIRKYSVQDMGKTLIAQSVCAAMIESYCDNTEKELLQLNELKGLYPVTRYSPGYGDFDIAFQKDILKLLGTPRIGLSLTDGFMLIPSKSITAIIGFSEEKRKIAAKCGSCDDKDCGFREEIQ